MRRGLVLAGFVVLPMAAAFVACGLDESGTASDGSADVTLKDGAPPSDVVVADVPIDVPQACSTLDATACVDANLPDGWTFAAIALSDQPCPSTDYAKTPYIHDPAPDGGCLCTCTPSGSFDCSGQVQAGTQGGCTGSKSFTFDAGNTSACIFTNWNDNHIAVGPVPDASAGTSSCDASAPAPPWSASSATACTPNCSADYCNAPSPFQRCVISTTSTTCPAPFTQQQPSLGTNAQVTASCSGCACSVDTPGACTADVVAYHFGNCTGGIDAAPSDGTCENLSNSVFSFRYSPTVPQVQCSPSGGTASAVFSQSITVCCLP